MSKSIKQLSPKELSAFCSQLAFILKAGVSVVEGISIMEEDASALDTKEILKEIYSHIEKGSSLSYALRQSSYFPDYMINMVDIGETSGRLEQVLLSLGSFYDNNDAINKSIVNAVAYPLVIIAMMAGVITLLVTKVLPIFNKVLLQLGVSQSGLSGKIMNIGNTMAILSSIIIGIVIFIAIVLYIVSKLKNGAKILNRAYSKMPLAKNIVKKISVTRFSSTMSLMLASGMDITTSLDMCLSVIEHDDYINKIKILKQDIESGISFNEAISNANIFNSLNNRMITVGCKTGELDKAMAKIAQHYEQDLEIQIGNIISIIEPTLVVILSTVVGIIILSVMMPLMSIMSTIA